MRKLYNILLVLILVAPILSATAQKETLGRHIIKNLPVYSLTAASGACDGVAELCKFHYVKLDKAINLNDDFWNYATSQNNKYRNHDPKQGPAFFGSTTALVGFTDGYHFMRLQRNLFAATAVTVAMQINIGQRQKWYFYLVDLVLVTASYHVGFWSTYEIINR